MASRWPFVMELRNAEGVEDHVSVIGFSKSENGSNNHFLFMQDHSLDS